MDKPTRPTATVLARLIDSPELVPTVRALPAATFAALVRRIGVEDAGELVALATTEQLVAAFDEDLFTNARPGEREAFDPARFAIWLEVLLEAGEAAAAQRIAELSEEFVSRALSALLLVLDYDAILLELAQQGDAARLADKAIESALAEEIDGYLLIARQHDGWDAALALVLALDRDHRALLERILDRAAAASRHYLTDLDAFTTALSDAESLAEDVEAERESRRARHGHLEPRAARAFLDAARQPSRDAARAGARHPIARRYFRELEPTPVAASEPSARGAETLRRAIAEVTQAPAGALPAATDRAAPTGRTLALVAALRLLGEGDPERLDARLQELAFVANAVAAGAAKPDGARFDATEAAEAALLTVALGAELEAGSTGAPRATAEMLHEVLRRCPADALFRRGSSARAASRAATEASLVLSPIDLEEALAHLRGR